MWWDKCCTRYPLINPPELCNSSAQHCGLHDSTCNMNTLPNVFSERYFVQFTIFNSLFWFLFLNYGQDINIKLSHKLIKPKYTFEKGNKNILFDSKSPKPFPLYPPASPDSSLEGCSITFRPLVNSWLWPYPHFFSTQPSPTSLTNSSALRGSSKLMNLSSPGYT